MFTKKWRSCIVAAASLSLLLSGQGSIKADVLPPGFESLYLAGPERYTLGASANATILATYDGDWNSDDGGEDRIQVTFTIDGATIKHEVVRIYSPPGSIPGTLIHINWETPWGGSGSHIAKLIVQRIDPSGDHADTLTLPYTVP